MLVLELSRIVDIECIHHVLKLIINNNLCSFAVYMILVIKTHNFFDIMYGDMNITFNRYIYIYIKCYVHVTIHNIKEIVCFCH